MGFQILGAILIGVFIGWQIDKYFNNTTPIATAILSLFGVIAGIYLALKDFINPQK